MVGSEFIRAAVVVFCTFGTLSLCVAQQVYTTAPLVTSSDSYYESIGTDWGFTHRGRNGYVFFNRGGSNSGIPTVGGYDPNAAGRIGVGTRSGNNSFYFNAWAGQGSNRSVTSTAPGLMLRNGGQGFVQDISVSPFVTSLIPVVGDRPISPVEERLTRLRQESAFTNPNSSPTDSQLLLGTTADEKPASPATSPSIPFSRGSSAERGDISLAEIRSRQASQPSVDPADEVNQLIETARLAEASGRLGAARIRYQQAAAKATGELQEALVAKYNSLIE
ncbi:MAG: hypothetical protein H6822_26085 [Planctomycetaceae bacterium]|nr:hypothetical protein [Planctomycetales bacterium]MCB9925647.1 hypothetical protein [Planctomycetaceae bacterium]